jgi:MFS family permease
MSLGVLLLLALPVIGLLDIPKEPEQELAAPARPLATIAAQPQFLVAVCAAGVGYGVMNLLMTATPLAMGACGHPFGTTASVISAHVVAMYLPSFVTGDLIRRFGTLRVMLWGVVLNAGCVWVAVAGVDVANFWAALVLLGVAWNFLYVGATTLLTETYHPAEKAKAQGANDMFIYLMMAVSSFLSGAVLERGGWSALNLSALPFLAGTGAVVWLLERRQRRSRSVAAV